MASCVPAKGSPLRKWFTDLAKELNVSEEWLEPVIHSYWNEYGDNTIPTADDILEHILGSNIVTSQEQLDIYQERYSSPIESLSSLEADAVVFEASKFFSPKAIVKIQAADGSWTVRVAEPLVSVLEIADNTQNAQKDNFFENENTFTFEDGTKVNAPFKLNAQQEAALNAMDAFVKSGDTSMTLSGYAGTGKTSITKPRTPNSPVLVTRDSFSYPREDKFFTKSSLDISSPTFNFIIEFKYLSFVGKYLKYPFK